MRQVLATFRRLQPFEPFSEVVGDSPPSSVICYLVATMTKIHVSIFQGFANGSRSAVLTSLREIREGS